MHPGPAPTFERYVAIGDSSTEGLDDPDGRGGYVGWSLRLARRLAAGQGRLLYANLAVRGLTTRQVRDGQLARALAMRPDLATVFCGTNDVLARRFDPGAVGNDVETMQRAFVAGGATVLTFTLPDLAPLIPMARAISPRIRLLNEALRAAASRSGALLVDFASHPVAADERLWSDDRIHANAAGHARIADALAHALGLPGSDDAWMRALPAAPPRSGAESVARELGWIGRHLLPWTWQGIRAAFATEPARMPKQPELGPVPGATRSAPPR